MGKIMDSIRKIGREFKVKESLVAVGREVKSATKGVRIPKGVQGQPAFGFALVPTPAPAPVARRKPIKRRRRR